MDLQVVDHPAVKHKLTFLRNPKTPHWEFEQLITEISSVLAVESTKNFATKSIAIETPLENTTGDRLLKRISLVPILRAGLAMVPAFKHLYPSAKVGLIGLARDEETLNPSEYYENVPQTIKQDSVIVLDPMLATGGSASYSLSILRELDVGDLILVSIIAAPEGVEKVQTDHPKVPIYTAALDRELNDSGYILPGLGDAGDRIFGNFY